MALKKSDLYSSLWKSADELRGGMDASQYKDYVLTLLFVKYVSDKAAASSRSLIKVPAGGSFSDLVALKGKADIGDQMNKAIRKLADANDLQGVINNADFNDPNKLGDGKARQDLLSNLIGIFEGIDFTASKAEGDDLLGDAYEYLMRHFATESGKSKGQFYTPAEVSRVMAQLLQIPDNTPKSTTVYDPTCGSGSLLIKVADASPKGLTIYGQEMDNATWALAKMNMILHGNETSTILQGNTLANPRFRTDEQLDTFDLLVANPPFSVKTWKNGVENDYGRFDGYAPPPAKNGDYAFLLHMVKSLKSTGRAAIVLPHGVLFRGNAEATIRKLLIKRGLIKAVIGLPPNLFYGTGIPACILVLDKKDAAGRTGIFMIDASQGFIKDGNKNRLRPRDMHKIVDAFVKQAEFPRYSRVVPVSEIANSKNDYNLNIPRYVDSSDPEDIQDLNGHLQGGIPNPDLDALQPYWDAFPSLRGALFRQLRDGYSELQVPKSDIQFVVSASAEYLTYASETHDVVDKWWTGHRGTLEQIHATTKSAVLITDLGESLLDIFRPRPLLDEYGVYEQLMSYWNTTMHDDVVLVMSEGWVEASRPRAARIVGTDNNGKPKYESIHLKFGTGARTKRWVMDLVPPEYIVARFFADERDRLLSLRLEAEMAGQAIAEYVEEHAVEEGLLWDAVDEGKDAVTDSSAKARLQEIGDDGDEEEIAALERVMALFKAEAAAKKAVRVAQAKLDEMTLARYGKLTEDEVRSLVIDDKWGVTLAQGIDAELSSLTHKLVARLAVLAARYELTVQDIEARMTALSAKVDGHLVAMGLKP
ncbi:type I restriction-modification system subunit M [Geodermatophilus sp. URMC 65]